MDRPWLQGSLEPIRQSVADMAKTDGFDIKRRHRSVSTVAENLGRGDQFQTFNKILSKFAHPTAVAVFASDEFNKAIRDKFREWGMAMAVDALRRLDEELGSVAEAPSITQDGPSKRES